MPFTTPIPTPVRPFYWSVAITSALAAAVILVTLWLSSLTRSQYDWVEHTLAIRNQLTNVLSLVQSAETGQRGYLLTDSQAYLIPYDRGVTGLKPALDELNRLVQDNPDQVRSVEQLRELITKKLGELRATVDARKAGRNDEALAIVRSDEGLRLMDAIRQSVTAMEAVEDRLLGEREARAEATNFRVQAGAGAALLLIVAAGYLGLLITRRSFTELAAMRDKLASVNAGLEEQMRQREQIESQLRQAQKMEAIGQLTGGIAHDFNNMLGVVSGSLELMERKLQKGETSIARFMDAALQATRRAALLTDRLLAFSRQQPLAPQPVNANALISSMSDLMRSTLGEHIQIETVTAAGLWPASADYHQLENAILNIAINARDAMPDGGRLTIETGNAYLDDAYARGHAEVDPGQYVMVALTDTGTGMPADVAARVFDPFFTTKPTGKGTGLGLSQVYGFIKQSRGHVKIYSEVGEGTTVKIYLPRAAEMGAPAAPSTSPPQELSGCGEVVLVVEDDPLMRKFTTEAVSELGYGVIEAENAAAALAVLEQRRDVDLLFTDVVMPDVNGKKLADTALRKYPELKVLYTTGYTANAVVHGGILDAGVNLLGKPFTMEQLARKLRSVLGQ
ncbi:CHASE3 domain-containing protein [Bradyrhizobium sp.]|uniref:CHASE3 domain-containing protein n=1 Tax=Bradyrhizobium sp. TaxID=376 RepID=UPI003C684FDC